MKAKIFLFLIFIVLSVSMSGSDTAKTPIRILVVTGNHSYDIEQFNLMFSSLGENITFQVIEFPGAYEMFLQENRSKYDVLVFYHMWQKIIEEQAKVFSECISEGKPLVALHHSICAFDDWPEYYNIIGGKYFHKPTEVNGKEYPACSYIHDINFNVRIVNKNHPVTLGLEDFEIFDEAYKGYYVEPGVIPLLTTEDARSNPVIGWTKEYGKATIVTIQCGHGVSTFRSDDFRKLLKQSVIWVYEKSKNNK